MANRNFPNLPPNFEPTPEEESLLDLYATVKSYERRAAKLREQAAKAKLAAADEKYHRDQEKNNGDVAAKSEGKKKSRKNKKPKAEKNTFHGGDSPQSGHESSEEGSDAGGDSDASGSDIEGTLAERREAKLAEMRDSIEAKRRTTEDEAAEAEELERQRHLTDAADLDEDIGPLIKKRKAHSFDKPAQSLITNIGGQMTPPHDFSKKLGMSRLSGRFLKPMKCGILSFFRPKLAHHGF